MPDKRIGAARTVRDAVRRVEDRLEAAGVHCGHGTDNTLDEAAWLVGGALQVAPAGLEARLDEVLPDPARTRLEALVAQRVATRKPTAYLLQEAWFAGLSFHVDERVIVPRSLTAEFIEERFAPWIDAARVRRLLDLCTGSGCIAIACAHAFPRARVDAADLSDDALAVARINVERYRLADRVRLIQSDLFAALAGERYDVVVTNPPYVAQAELDALPAEYRHEPRVALASGEHGLDAVIRILAQAHAHLEPHGILVAEVGNAGETLQATFPDVPFTWLSTQTGDESVFLLTAAQLGTYRDRFAAKR